VNLAKMYHDGIGVEKDLKKAHDLFQNGAKHGDPLGYVNLGMMYQTGEYVGKDMNMAIEYYTKAADLGCYPGLLNLALIYQTGNGVPVDGLKAVEYYERGSKFDKSGAAENNIGIIYYLGCGTVQKNLKKAYEAFEKSAKKNCAQGQYHLGILYINGEYVEKNGKIGIDYVKKAAEQDYQPAVDYMKQIKQARRQMLLNSMMNGY
jgi:TPR repeat protein